MRQAFQMDGVPGATFTQTSTNVAAVLTAANLLSSNGNRAISVLITCETNDVKFCLGDAVPVSSGLGHILAVEQSILLTNSGAISGLQIISAVAGAHGVLMITPFFEPGR